MSFEYPDGAILVADGAKLIALDPIGPVGRFGERATHVIIKFEVSRDTAPVPIGIIFVLGAMIAVLGIILGRRHAGGGAAIHQILAAFEIEHRQTMLGEAEMVRAIIIALLRRRLHRRDPALRGQSAVQIGV